MTSVQLSTACCNPGFPTARSTGSPALHSHSFSILVQRGILPLANPLTIGIGSTKSQALQRLWQGGLDLLFPPRCVSCHAWGNWFCSCCREQVAFLDPPLCQCCSRPLHRHGLCADCQKNPPPFEGIRAAAAFGGPLRTAILQLKFGGARAVAEPLAELLWERWQEEPLPVTLVVPVPAHRTRLRERGYNQAALLVKPLARRIGLPMAEQALSRTRPTEKQIVLTAADRWENVRGAFVADAGLVEGHDVLLVDDICTTTATIACCATTLEQAGAHTVWGFVVARTCIPPADRDTYLPDHPMAETIDIYRESP